MLEDNLAALPDRWRQIVVRQLRVLWAQNDTAAFQFWPAIKGEGHEVPDRHKFTVAHYSVLFERGLFVPVVLAAALGVALISRGRRWNEVALFLGLLVAAYAAAHLAIEVQPRYRYPVMPAIFALTSPLWAGLTRDRARQDL
ncbi:MAG: hypothetical protein LBJ02_07085 [Bifidobacteriaceae bacterium]|nr:hypothetical protein [Bifidobacteriaceae bacterium]